MRSKERGKERGRVKGRVGGRERGSYHLGGAFNGLGTARVDDDNLVNSSSNNTFLLFNSSSFSSSLVLLISDEDTDDKYLHGTATPPCNFNTLESNAAKSYLRYHITKKGKEKERNNI